MAAAAAAAVITTSGSFPPAAAAANGRSPLLFIPPLPLPQRRAISSSLTSGDDSIPPFFIGWILGVDFLEEGFRVSVWSRLVSFWLFQSWVYSFL